MHHSIKKKRINKVKDYILLTNLNKNIKYFFIHNKLHLEITYTELPIF